MKKHDLFLTLLLVGVILHLGSTDSYSSYLIGFNNGRTLYAENYRIEGEHIFLYFGSGIMKFTKSEVKSISEEKDEIKEERKEEISQIEKNSSKIPDKNVLAKDPVKRKDDIEYLKKKKAELSERLEEAKKNYFDAQDRSDKDRARKIMVSVSKELFTLEEEVMKKNNGVLPDWWKQ